MSRDQTIATTTKCKKQQQHREFSTTDSKYLPRTAPKTKPAPSDGTDATRNKSIQFIIFKNLHTFNIPIQIETLKQLLPLLT